MYLAVILRCVINVADSNAGGENQELKHRAELLMSNNRYKVQKTGE